METHLLSYISYWTHKKTKGLTGVILYISLQAFNVLLIDVIYFMLVCHSFNE